MPDAAGAVAAPSMDKPGSPDTAPKRVQELRVSGHLMYLEPGVFCVFHVAGWAANQETGLPGVRISLPPAAGGLPGTVSISTFRPDGWLSGGDVAALVRVTGGPAQVLVTVYQAPGQTAEAAPRLQVLRLGGETPAEEKPVQAGQPVAAAAGALPSVIAHVQRAGDVGGAFGEWLGERGSKAWVEGFAIMPPPGIAAEDIEYQAVLGRSWNSPWVEAGQFCGSRGMALPLLGLRVRLHGKAAEMYRVSYAASFVDGTEVGPVEEGEACESANLAAVEALRIMLEPRAEAGGPAA